jgi:hypothetical protein
MSRDRGRAAFNLEKTDMVPQVEWYWPMSKEAYLNITGIDPAEDVKGAALAVIEKLELDFSWGGIPDPSSVSLPGSDFSRTDPAGDRIEPWGVFSTKWRTEGAHLRVGDAATARDVLEFDVESYEERSVSELAREYQRIHDRNEREIGDRLLVGEAHYTTLFHWFLGLFGWRATVEAGMRSPSGFARQAERFVELSRRHLEAWSRVRGLEVFISHDDICMSNGPIFSPRWYRKHIFPHYPEVWEPIKERGIPVVFCSDGDVTSIMGDVFEAGADGFIFEPYVDLKWAADRWGGEKVLIGNVDTRLLTGGTPEQAVQEVERCIRACGDIPGYFLNAGGQLPHTIPWENLKAYLDACRRLRPRPG